MNKAHSIIKYFAIALAVIIIFSIIAFAFRLIEFLVPFDHKYNYNFNDQKKVLNIELKVSNLVIKKGDALKVETSNKYIDVKKDSKKLSVIEKRNSFFSSNKRSDIIIYIPDNNFDDVFISTGAGKIDISSLTTNELSFEMGAGEVIADNLKVFNKTKIEGGAGKINISSSELANLNLELGVGKFNLDAKLNGQSEISAGIGSVNIDLIGDKSNYQIKSSKGLGTITIDGANIKNDTTYGNGINTIDLEGGIGSINVSFK